MSDITNFTYIYLENAFIAVYIYQRATYETYISKVHPFQGCYEVFEAQKKFVRLTS